MRSLLTPNQQRVLIEEKEFLQRLATLFQKIEADNEDLVILNQTLARLDSLFSLVVVGEFNSGKSSFLNALLGNTYLKDGVTPTTSTIDVLSYGDK